MLIDKNASKFTLEREDLDLFDVATRESVGRPLFNRFATFYKVFMIFSLIQVKTNLYQS